MKARILIIIMLIAYPSMATASRWFLVAISADNNEILFVDKDSLKVGGKVIQFWEYTISRDGTSSKAEWTLDCQKSQLSIKSAYKFDANGGSAQTIIVQGTAMTPADIPPDSIADNIQGAVCKKKPLSGNTLSESPSDFANFVFHQSKSTPTSAPSDEAASGESAEDSSQ